MPSAAWTPGTLPRRVATAHRASPRSGGSGGAPEVPGPAAGDRPDGRIGLPRWLVQAAGRRLGNPPYTGTVADWPPWFTWHGFGSYCFGVQRCNVRYAGLPGESERPQSSTESRGRP